MIFKRKEKKVTPIYGEHTDGHGSYKNAFYRAYFHTYEEGQLFAEQNGFVVIEARSSDAFRLGSCHFAYNKLDHKIQYGYYESCR